MSKKVLLLHGWGGSDSPHWQSWLRDELRKDSYEVSFLNFSDPHYPKLNVWKDELKKELDRFKPDVVVCHSLANTLWFHLCEEEDDIDEVTELYLVAPPSFNCNIDTLNSFFPMKIPTKTKAKHTLLVTSTNDQYMNVDEAKELQNSLGVPMEVLQDGGHINADSGFGEWPWILKKIKGDIV